MAFCFLLRIKTAKTLRQISEGMPFSPGFHFANKEKRETCVSEEFLSKPQVRKAVICPVLIEPFPVKFSVSQ